MGMTYIIGFNESSPLGEQWTEFETNSTGDAYLSQLISDAIKIKYPDVYEQITLQSPFQTIYFNELDPKVFMEIVTEIRKFSEQKSLNEVQKKGAEIWHLGIEPLVQIDERYDPNFKL